MIKLYTFVKNVSQKKTIMDKLIIKKLKLDSSMETTSIEIDDIMKSIQNKIVQDNKTKSVTSCKRVY